MKRFLTSTNYINDSKKIRVYNNDLVEEATVDDPTASHAEEKSEAPPSESESYNRKNNIKLSNNYLFDGQFYNIISNVGKKLIAKCVLCSKTIQGQDNSTGNFLSHIKVCFYLFIKLYNIIQIRE